IPPANIPALPSQFSDIPQSVIDCWDARANYTSASSFLYSELLNSATWNWTAWSTTSYSLAQYIDERYDCKTTALPSLTTLCDGYPRASTLLKDAYDWRTAQLQAQIPTPTGSIAGPGCSVLSTPTPNAKPTCVLEGGTWEAFYWPTPMPTGSAFCAANLTHATGTPTIPGRANTAVVSGLTLTSPSLYHFIRNVTLKTFVGTASLVGRGLDGQKLYSQSTVAAFLTVAQRESDILTISRLCAGSNKHRYCTFDASNGFSIADQTTVRASEYCGQRGCGTSETVYQDNYKPTLGIPASEIVTQNGAFMDCAWTTTGARVRTKGPAVYNVGLMKSEDWHKITLTGDDTGRSLETAAPVTSG
ncbi:hypothetical protein BDV96DRAFT_485650, partial [Lophiotrema nucula]